MIIYMAGNTPDRVRQEKELIAKGINKRSLLSYYFFLTDITMRQVFDFWRKIC